MSFPASPTQFFCNASLNKTFNQAGGDSLWISPSLLIGLSSSGSEVMGPWMCPYVAALLYKQNQALCFGQIWPCTKPLYQFQPQTLLCPQCPVAQMKIWLFKYARHLTDLAPPKKSPNIHKVSKLPQRCKRAVWEGIFYLSIDYTNLIKQICSPPTQLLLLSSVF